MALKWPGDHVYLGGGVGGPIHHQSGINDHRFQTPKEHHSPNNPGLGAGDNVPAADGVTDAGANKGFANTTDA